MTGKDLSLHPPPPACARISNPTTWPHSHPSKIPVTCLWICLCHDGASDAKYSGTAACSAVFRKVQGEKMFKGSFRESPDDRKERWNFTIKPCSQYPSVGAIWKLNTEPLREVTNWVKTNIKSYLRNYIGVLKCLLPSPLFKSVEITKEFVC